MEILFNIAAIVENSDRLLGNVQFFWTLFLITSALASIHLLAHYFHRFFKNFELFFASFSGGLAIAYIFLELFPELEDAEQVLGKSIHIITLIGFIIFYGIQSLILQNSIKKKAIEHRVFYTEISFLFVYNALIIYTIPDRLEAFNSGLILYFLAMGLHLLINNYALRKKHDNRFYQIACYILAFSLFIGFLLNIFVDPLLNEVISDMLTAMLAGFVLFNVFVEELPHPKSSTFLWFLGGIGFYIILLGEQTI